MAEYRHYNKGREIDQLGNYYTRHVSAMTTEGLHSKSAIAAELGWRDSEIDRLHDELVKLRKDIETTNEEIEQLASHLEELGEICRISCKIIQNEK